jgi:hypothetical protein
MAIRREDPLPFLVNAMALYRFFFAPVLLAVAVLAGPGGQAPSQKQSPARAAHVGAAPASKLTPGSRHDDRPRSMR